jgi:hypothetical protein
MTVPKKPKPSVVRIYILGLMASVTLLALYGCTEEKYDPVSDFYNAIEQRQEKSEQFRAAFQRKDNKRWLKHRTRVTNISYDVLKNDSLINPYKGIVSFTVLNESSDEVDTEAEADATTVFPDESGGFTAVLTYIGSEKGWRMVEGSYFFNGEPQNTYPLNPTRITTIGGPPFAQLIDWL